MPAFLSRTPRAARAPRTHFEIVTTPLGEEIFFRCACHRRRDHARATSFEVALIGAA